MVKQCLVLHLNLNFLSILYILWRPFYHSRFDLSAKPTLQPLQRASRLFYPPRTSPHLGPLWVTCTRCRAWSTNFANSWMQWISRRCLLRRKQANILTRSILSQIVSFWTLSDIGQVCAFLYYLSLKRDKLLQMHCSWSHFSIHKDCSRQKCTHHWLWQT